MAAATYQVKPAFLRKNPAARTQVNGEGVSLNGSPQVIKIEGSAAVPGYEKQYRAATQADLQYLYEVKNMTDVITKTEAPASAGKGQTEKD